jgi:pimeloyl-ACP methyl ester carboxylesterase
VEHVTSSDGTRIVYERTGSGRPLVLVHGTSVEHFTFRFVQPLLSDRFTLYSVDRRGRGESGDSATGYAIDQEFADIASLVDSFEEPADLFGHSYGATVALGAAARARNLRRLVLYEPAPGIPLEHPELLARLDELLAEGQREQLLSVFLAEAGVDPDTLEQLRASPVWAGRVAAAHTIPRELRSEENYQPDPETLSSRSIPALLLLGSESPEWAKKGTQLVQSLLPDSRVAVLEGEGHLAILTAPQLVSHGLLDQDESAPQPAQPPVEGALTRHLREVRAQVLQGIAHEAAFGLPGHPAAPLGGERQAQHFAVA